jgi:hypothetical protein
VDEVREKTAAEFTVALEDAILEEPSGTEGTTALGDRRA